MAKKNILVFPCGSEVALEIYRSLEHSIHFNLIGANSIDDHGRFVYSNYIGDIPFATEQDFIPRLKQIVSDNNIDAIYPAMDSVITVLKQNENLIGCKVIASEQGTTEICLSKSKTYETLKDVVATPQKFSNIQDIDQYPVFLKPDIGYGSRGVKKAHTAAEAIEHLSSIDNLIILEYLPGPEYTVDCFTDFNGDLLFVGPRQRKRIVNGISVNTSTMPLKEKFKNIAESINSRIRFNGAWFFQVKENAKGDLVLLEIASRIAGSSSVYRQKGVNFASLTLFNAFNISVSLIENDYTVELDRALDNKYKVDLAFNNVYVDLDDTIIVNEVVNVELVSILYKFINEGKKVILITKHVKDIDETLKKYRLSLLFDEVIHLKRDDNKALYIKSNDSIFIDDSFLERKSVYQAHHIPVFAPDMVQVFM